MEELVSIIIPVYNCEQYLQRTLETVTGQSYQNLEIIYVDDGSSDGSADVIRSYMKKDQRIKLISQTNHGVSYARNAGLKAASGTLITFADADDYVDPHYVETMVTAIWEEQADIACSSFILHRPDLDIPFHDDGKKHVWNAIEAQKCLVSGEFLEPGVWAKMFRRKMISDILFHSDVKYYEDYLWALEAFCRCNKVVFLAKATYHYVLHPNSATTNAPALKRLQDSIYVTETAAAMPFTNEIHEILDRKRLVGYLDNYNSLLYCKGQGIKLKKREIRQKILSEKEQYSRLCLSLRERFFYCGIKICPGGYQYLFRILKWVLPDRRVFRI